MFSRRLQFLATLQAASPGVGGGYAGYTDDTSQTFELLIVLSVHWFD